MTDLPTSSFSELNPGEQIVLGDQIIRCDRSRTVRAYETVVNGGAAGCKCSYCRNFIALRGSAYPASFLSLLDRLGIDPEKEGEVYEIGPAEEGRRVHGGWFFFVGQILDVGESQSEEDGVTYWAGDGKSLPRPDGDFGLDLLALNFTLTVPWVLAEEA